MICEKCGTNWPDEDSYIHRHHIYPKGWKTDDQTILLCMRCHRILHHILPKIIGDKLKNEDMKAWENVNRTIYNFTKRWIKCRS